MKETNGLKIKNRINPIGFIQCLCACLTISFMVFGLIAYLPYKGWMLWIGSFGMWGILACFRDQKFLLTFIYKARWLLVFSLMLLLFEIYTVGTLNSINSPYIGIVMMYAFYIFYKNEGRIKGLETILLYFLIEQSIKIPICIYLFVNDPLIARRLMDPDIDGLDIPYNGMVPSFHYTYVVLFLILILIAFWSIMSKSMKVWSAYIIVSGCILVLVSGFATASILLLAGILSVLLIKDKRKLIGAFLITIIFTFFISDIFSSAFVWLSNEWILSDITSQKLGEVALYLATGSAGDSTMIDRFGRTGLSIDAFFDHPLLGIYQVADAQAGGHTYWFDIFAQFGVLRGFPLFMFYYGWAKEMVEKEIILISNKTFIPLLFIALSGFFNPTIDVPTVPIIFFILPLLNKVIKNKSTSELLG